MSIDSKELSELLESIANALDISDTHYEQAIKHYESIGKWMSRDGSIVARCNRDIYPQGSFALGTVTKPVSDVDEYDMDLVSELSIRKKEITQEELKNLVGKEIKAYARADHMSSFPKAGRRHWTLNYADEVQFHMDILPAIPDADTYKQLLESRGHPLSSWSDSAIAITDNTLPNYRSIDPDWPRSNPKGYSAWFRSRMDTAFSLRRKGIAEASRIRVEDVPEYKVKTPLQRAIQILKRHRDIMFAEDPDDKPISIIITTLAGFAYNNETDILNTLKILVTTMPQFIRTVNGVTRIPNPVDPLENFADKWREHPQRKQKFYEWLRQAQTDLEKALKLSDIPSVLESLKPCLGERIVNETRQDRSKSTNASVRTRATSVPRDSSRFNIAHREAPPWMMKPNGWVGITCKASPEESTPHKTEVMNDSPPLPKNWDLEFGAQTDIPQPYEVHWQVVNTGTEARAAKDLRGGFYKSIPENGRRTKDESTAYKGMHWIECFYC